MEAEVGTPINYDPDEFINKEQDQKLDEPEPENNEQYYFPPPQHVLRTVSTTRHKRKIYLQI